MFAEHLLALARDVLERARVKRVHLATAESCTGGLIAGCLTAVAGSSDVFDRGFVTYSNEAKIELLGVHSLAIARHGAVSREVAAAMATGALAHSRADCAVSCTGIAGPGGGSSEKPVGLVYIGIAMPLGRVDVVEERFGDLGRDRVREKTVEAALQLMQSVL